MSTDIVAIDPDDPGAIAKGAVDDVGRSVCAEDKGESWIQWAAALAQSSYTAGTSSVCTFSCNYATTF